jgi:hypothetical protein
MFQIVNEQERAVTVALSAGNAWMDAGNVLNSTRFRERNVPYTHVAHFLLCSQCRDETSCHRCYRVLSDQAFTAGFALHHLHDIPRNTVRDARTLNREHALSAGTIA